jgi:hypothetical protein
MTAASIRKKIESYLQVADEKKIKMIYTLLEDEIEHEERISIKQYNQELKEAEDEYSRGECITNEEMKKQVMQW